MREMPDNSVDSIVTDPPYGLSFMGKKWDYDVPSQEIWEECLRVLKPGGYLLAFAGTRTQHRMAVRIEDAGFEIRDMIAWIYGSGFPKSLNIGKSVNQLETNEWTKISKALDNMQKTDIIRVWKSNSNNVNIVAELSQRPATEAGTHTDLNDSVLLSVVLPASQEKQNTNADTVEMALSVHQATPTKINTVLQNVVAEIKQLQKPVKFAEVLPPSQNHKHSTTSTAQESVKDTPSENTVNKTRVEEALKTLRGKKKYSDEETINAICAVLTENLLHTILSQSKTFQSLDTTSKTECASATTVTITEYMAECLITYTVGIAKSKAVDKLQGNEREAIADNPNDRKSRDNNLSDYGLQGGVGKGKVTKGNSPYEGWGTALKPALEPITVARKPLSEKTVANNVLKHGTGGINIDGCRVGNEEVKTSQGDGFGDKGIYGTGINNNKGDVRQGRFPANLIHDGGDEVVGLFPESKSTGGKNGGKLGQSVYGKFANETLGANAGGLGDSGSAARFFYCAKASKADRNEGCEDVVTNENGTERKGNIHSTVKPTKLMQYLVRLVTPKGGTVLDPFMGSGSTGKACVAEGFGFIGIELDEEYFKIAEARTKHQQQPKLF